MDHMVVMVMGHMVAMVMNHLFTHLKVLGQLSPLPVTGLVMVAPVQYVPHLHNFQVIP